MYAVIMAGGKGTRFWPLSRKKKPKHLLNITGMKTIIQYTMERVTPLVEKDNILIVTGANHCDEIREQLPELPAENILIEPVGRNTALCIRPRRDTHKKERFRCRHVCSSLRPSHYKH